MSDDSDKEKDDEKARRPRKSEALIETEDLALPSPSSLRPKTPGFFDASSPRIDPWTEVTPPQAPESTSPEIETYDAEFEVSRSEQFARSRSEASEDGTVAVPSYRASEPEPEEAHDDPGADGPVAAPLDSPSFVRTSSPDKRTPKGESAPKRAPRPRLISELQKVGFGAAPYTAPVHMERRTGREKLDAKERALVPRRKSGVGISKPESPRPKD